VRVAYTRRCEIDGMIRVLKRTAKKPTYQAGKPGKIFDRQTKVTLLTNVGHSRLKVRQHAVPVPNLSRSLRVIYYDLTC